LDVGLHVEILRPDKSGLRMTTLAGAVEKKVQEFKVEEFESRKSKSSRVQELKVRKFKNQELKSCLDARIEFY